MDREDLSERVAKLELTARRYRAVLTCVGVTTLTILAGLAAMEVTGRALAQKPESTKKTIRANQIDLVDSNGNHRGGMAVTPDGAALFALSDANGLTRFQVYVNNDGPVLNLADENRQIRVVLGPGKTEQAGKLTTYTESSIRLFDGSGSMIWSAP